MIFMQSGVHTLPWAMSSLCAAEAAFTSAAVAAAMDVAASRICSSKLRLSSACYKHNRSILFIVSIYCMYFYCIYLLIVLLYIVHKKHATSFVKHMTICILTVSLFCDVYLYSWHDDLRAIYFWLAGHPLRGWPARLRGHKGSGLWKVWTVPSPPPTLPSPPLPSPPLPSPSPPLPCPPRPSLPSPPLPPSLPRAQPFGRAMSPKRRSADTDERASVVPPGDH